MKYRILKKTNTQNGSSTYTVQERKLLFFWATVLVRINWRQDGSNESPSLLRAENLIDQLEEKNHRKHNKYIKSVICTTK